VGLWVDLEMRKIVFLLIALLILINGCASYVDVKVLRPSTINLGNIRNLAVSDFEFVGSWSFDEKEEPETISEIAKEALKRSFDIIEDVIEPPDPYTAFPGQDVSAKFITKIIENGHYSVIERDILYKLLAEQKLSMSGIISEDNTTRLGEMLGVDAFIIGSGNYSVNDDGGWYQRTKDDKKYVYYRINRKVTVQLTYKIISVETGEIIASKENSAKNYDTSDLTRAIFNNQYFDYIEAVDEKTARSKIPEWQPIVNKLTDKLIKKSIKQIAPYYSKTSREIKTGNSHSMKTGLEYAKRKLWEDAKESWESVLTDNSPNARQDRIHAMYNLGVYNEINSELDIAEEYFEKCFELSGKNEYLDARVRIQKRKKKLKKRLFAILVDL
jgi:curli biogenesis system outer membrane secretion channel CsgG